MAEEFFWLSFADGDLPTGEQFLGVVIIKSTGFLAAVSESHRAGLNPGGECAGGQLPPMEVPAEYLNRLLDKPAALAVAKLVDKAAGIGASTNG